MKGRTIAQLVIVAVAVAFSGGLIALVRLFTS